MSMKAMIDIAKNRVGSEKILKFLDGVHLLTVMVISRIPSIFFRNLFYKALGMKIGKYSYIRFGAQIQCPWNVTWATTLELEGIQI